MQRVIGVSGKKLARALALVTMLAVQSLAFAQASSDPTVDRIRSTSKLTLGYYDEARPFTYQGSPGQPDGYAIAICKAVAASLQEQLKMSSLATEFVQVQANDRYPLVKEGKVDLLCGPSVPTLSSRAEVSFSLPILESGTAILLRKDAPNSFRELLETGHTADRPVWRGSPMLAALQERNFVVIGGSLQEKLLTERRDELHVNSIISTVPDLATGVKMLLDGRADAFVGERSVLLDQANRNGQGKLVVINRVFDREEMAFALSRDDPDFRLLVDTALSQLYLSGKINAIYEQYLGKPDDATKTWFRRAALHE
ncbi:MULTISPECIES: amino acid ABC transporter substrate-binding protein [Dyella]|nr:MULTISPECIES: amino acid ABC transporter substrate-binding protein [Dyella]